VVYGPLAYIIGQYWCVLFSEMRKGRLYILRDRNHLVRLGDCKVIMGCKLVDEQALRYSMFELVKFGTSFACNFRVCV
jgi:hypothetical protein